MQPQELKKILDERFSAIFSAAADPFLPQSTITDDDSSAVKVRPTVVVGLGGSGVKSAARLNWRLDNFFRDDRFAMERRLTSFVVMDTLTYDNIGKEDPESARYIYPVISRDDYVELGGFNPGEYLKKQLPLSPDLQSWWDDSYHPPQQTIEVGAKRVRQLGRLALYRNKDRARTKIGNAINQVVQLQRKLVNEGNARVSGTGLDIDIYIFSGTCGGTGSGTLIDTLDMCYTEAKRLQKNPVIHLVLVMPGVYVQANRSQPGSKTMADACEANGYALFKELSYLMRHAPQFDKLRLDAKERHGKDESPPENWRPKRVYLVDTEIWQREVSHTEMNHLYMLAADYIFQVMVSAAGFLEVARGTNMVDELVEYYALGQMISFSSFGISYIVYPSKTFARSLSCTLLKESLDLLLKTPTEPGEKKRIVTLAQEIHKALELLLSPAQIDEQFLAGATNFADSLRSGEHILKEWEQHRGPCQPLLDDADRLGDQMEQRCKQRVVQNVDAFKSDALRGLERLLAEQVQARIPEGLEVLKGALKALKQGVETSSTANPVADATPHERIQKETYDLVGELEGKTFVWRRRKKITDAVYKHAQAVLAETDLTIKACAFKMRGQYLVEAAMLIENAYERIKNATQVVGYIRDEMGSRQRGMTPEFDEMSVAVTTQYIPVPPTIDGLARMYEDLKLNVREFVTNDLMVPEFRQGLWKLGSKDEGEARDAVPPFLVNALSRAIGKTGAPILKKSVGDVIQELWKTNPREFREQIGQQLLNLSDPCWALRTDDIPQSENKITTSIPVCAYPHENFPSEKYLPTELQGTPQPGDPRMMVVLRSEHGAPLFAVRGIMSYRETYRRWLQRYLLGQEAPIHLNSNWNKSEDALPDIGPITPPGGPQLNAFTFGMFADWLVQEKTNERLLPTLVADKPCGPICVRGRQYVYVPYALNKSDQKLHWQGEVSLDTTLRNEAARMLPVQALEAVNAFQDWVDRLVPDAEQDVLLTEYIAWLKEKYKHLSIAELSIISEHDQESRISSKIDGERDRHLARHLVLELKTLEKFKLELKGG
jgi:hypothetical protein